MNPEIDALRDKLSDSADLDECEEALASLRQLLEGDDHSVIHEAEDKIDTLKRDGREELQDSFTGDVKIVESLSDGRMKVQAIVSQVDTVNANKRRYPKSEMTKALSRANVLAKRGGVVALADHPDFFSEGGVRDIVVRWDKFMLKGKDVHAEGVTVLTDAGKDVTIAWQSGVALEWSTRGYGTQNRVEKKGKLTHYDILDYIMDGVDVVLRGAAKTKTLSLNVDNKQRPEEAEDTAMTDAEKKIEEERIAEEAKKAEELRLAEEAKAAEEKRVADAKTADEARIAEEARASESEVVKQLRAELKESNAENATALDKKLDERLAADKVERDLASYKTDKLKDVVLEADLRKPIERAVARATSTTEVDEVFEDHKAMLEKLMKPEPMFEGIGIRTERSRAAVSEDNWVLDGIASERPETPDAVRSTIVKAFTESLPADEQKMIPGTRAFTFDAAIRNLWDDAPGLFELATRDGVRQARMYEAATTTTTMGTVQPMILPMLYSLWPKLIPFEIASVQPLMGPSGVIHSLAIQDASNDEDLSDSSNFDSTFADHVEAATKSQIKPVITQQTVTAYEKAIHYDVTSALRQDMRAVHGIDLDSLMIAEATNQIAREINLTFLDLMLQGASALTQTYGTQVPASPTYNTQEWNNRLGAFVMRAKTAVQEKVYETPDWVVVGPGAAGVLQAMNAGGIQIGDRIQYGSGLNFIGIMGNTTRVYEATWFSRNDMLFGFRPPTWSHTGAVYAPYIPLYVSPEDYTASTNTYARSVATRMAMKLTNGDCYSRITIANQAGIDISSW